MKETQQPEKEQFIIDIENQGIESDSLVQIRDIDNKSLRVFRSVDSFAKLLNIDNIKNNAQYILGSNYFVDPFSQSSTLVIYRQPIVYRDHINSYIKFTLDIEEFKAERNVNDLSHSIYKNTLDEILSLINNHHMQAIMYDYHFTPNGFQRVTYYINRKVESNWTDKDNLSKEEKDYIGYIFSGVCNAYNIDPAIFQINKDQTKTKV